MMAKSSPGFKGRRVNLPNNMGLRHAMGGTAIHPRSGIPRERMDNGQPGIQCRFAVCGWRHFSRGSNVLITSTRSSSVPDASLAPSASPSTFWKLFSSKPLADQASVAEELDFRQRRQPFEISTGENGRHAALHVFGADFRRHLAHLQAAFGIAVERGEDLVE